jgi:hypothetical protein
MNSPANIWEQFETELHPRLTAVGFVSVEFPATAPSEPSGVVYTAFEAPYALLFCVRIPNESVDGISVATGFACETMRAELVKAGASDWTRDGYVLAAIQAPPASPETLACLSNFEQNRSICRRHTIWPDPQIAGNGANPWTTRLDRVTVLALPEPETPMAPAETQVERPQFLDDILNRLKRGDSYKLIAEGAVHAARQREDFHAS